MIPKSFSASSAAVYEECPARWAAEYLDKAPGIGGSAAGLGTACHKAIEDFVVQELHKLPPDEQLPYMLKLYDAAYWENFSDKSRYDEGKELVAKWLERQDWTGRTVVSTEVKEHIFIQTSAGPIRFNYVIDRLDELDNGDVEVVDYKSVVRPVPADALKSRVQARSYAMVIALRYKKARRIWVTFDLLRYTAVGVVFTIDECRETLTYLRDLLERIIADDDPKEKLNENCRWCLRRHKCETLKKHLDVGGPLSITDPNEAAEKRHELKMAIPALQAQLDDLDRFLMAHGDQVDGMGFDAGGVRVSFPSQRKRVVSMPKLAAAIGADRALAMGSVTVKDVEELLKDPDLTDDERDAIRASMGYHSSPARVDTKPVKAKP